MGWCMGDCYACCTRGQVLDPDIRNIVTVASPIDLESGRRGRRRRGQYRQWLGATGEQLHQPAPAGAGPGPAGPAPWATTLVFKMTDPVGSVTTYWDLVTRMSDRESLKSYSTTADYLNNMLLYPGGCCRIWP